MRKKTKQPYQKFDRTYYTSDGYEEYLTEQEVSAETEMIRPLLDALQPKKNWSFLDVGCAMGGALAVLRKMGYACRGTEISPYCLEHSSVKDMMMFGESFSLPCADRSFDIVMNCDVFEYLTCKQAMRSIREFTRVAKRYVSLWVFSPYSFAWSQEDNPDALRIQDTQSITHAEYVAQFEKNGMILQAFEQANDERNSYLPDWHFIFRHDHE